MKVGTAINTSSSLTRKRQVGATERYGIAESLPGHSIVGLRGWDDFIVRDSAGQMFAVPTVPLVARYLKPLDHLPDASLECDDSRAGRIKWYVKPLVFGGDPELGDNVIWVTHEDHISLVRWWNRLYATVKG